MPLILGKKSKHPDRPHCQNRYGDPIPGCRGVSMHQSSPEQEERLVKQIERKRIVRKKAHGTRNGQQQSSSERDQVAHARKIYKNKNAEQIVGDKTFGEGQRSDKITAHQTFEPHLGNSHHSKAVEQNDAKD